ncbi:MAG: hypothetical protein PHG87_05960 [Candidatus Omnitrophica bacterium]|nr:hypothetical protein [Candidatus Omnitrophota bacterium]
MEQEQINQTSSPLELGQFKPKGFLDGLVDFVESLDKTFRKIINSEGFKLFIDSLAQIGKILVDYANKTAKAADIILINMGWWILPEWTPTDIFNVVLLYREGKEKQIEKQIMTFFDNKKLNKMLKEWKQSHLLKSRIHILKDAIWAHNQGKYTLSVPALLPQLEGIMVEGLELKGNVRYKEIKDSFQDKLKASEVDFIFTIKSSGYRIIEQYISEKFEWGQITSSKFSRHAILHGHYTNYNRKKTSLKLILLIDYVQKVLSNNLKILPSHPSTIQYEDSLVYNKEK